MATTSEGAVVLPVATVEAVEDVLRQVVRHLAGTSGVEAQGLAGPAQAVLLELVAAHSRSDEALRLWGPSREAPTVPTRLRALPGGGS